MSLKLCHHISRNFAVPVYQFSIIFFIHNNIESRSLTTYCSLLSSLHFLVSVKDRLYLSNENKIHFRAPEGDVVMECRSQPQNSLWFIGSEVKPSGEKNVSRSCWLMFAVLRVEQ